MYIKNKTTSNHGVFASSPLPISPPASPSIRLFNKSSWLGKLVKLASRRSPDIICFIRTKSFSPWLTSELRRLSSFLAGRGERDNFAAFGRRISLRFGAGAFSFSDEVAEAPLGWELDCDAGGEGDILVIFNMLISSGPSSSPDDSLVK